ncbi:MAG: glycosyltransferase [Chloroherpetonaceae bacterium]|nr:glycosyltransferase [Chloroherpetonaceae bacterium]
MVCVCYNQSRYVTQALDSIAEQTYKSMQVIIIDNGSTDELRYIIQKWIKKNKDDRYEFYTFEKNVGVCKALNFALRKARGEFFGMMAADDVLIPCKTETLLEELKKRGEDVAIAYGDAVLIGDDGNYSDFLGNPVSRPITFLECANLSAEDLQSGEVFKALLENNFLHNLASLIRKNCIFEVGLYDEKLAYEDWDMNLRLARKYRVVYVPKVLAKYRRHSRSYSKDWGKNTKLSISTIRTFLKHYPCLKDIDAVIVRKVQGELAKLLKADIVRFLYGCLLVMYETGDIRFFSFIKDAIKRKISGKSAPYG